MAGRILKINILSLLAMPFLLVATLSELLARALEKIPIILRMVCAGFIIIAIADTFRNNTGLNPSLEIAILVGICFVVITVAVWVLSIFSSILDFIWHFLVMFLDWIYDFTYRIFLSLNEICETEYRILSFGGFGIFNSILCFCYILLNRIDWVIIRLLGLSVAVSFLASAMAAAGIIAKRADEITATYGMSLTAYLQAQDIPTIIYECIFLLAIIVPITTVLLSLGREWHDWAVELQLDSMEYEEYIDAIQDYDINFEGDEEPDEEALYMQGILNDHTGTVDQMYDEVEDALSIKYDALLKNQWNEYLQDLFDLIDEIEYTYHNEIPHNEFRKMMLRINRLERQRNDIFRGIDAILELAQNPANTSVFFIGCDSRTMLDKRYRELCKAYHPDSAGGDQDTFIMMQQEYKELKELITN